MSNKLKLLLHTCCGFCGSWVPDELSLKFDVDLFYYNPNIHPEEEYQRRLESVRGLAEIMNLKLIEGVYTPIEWFKDVRGLSQEPEGGKRCLICFEHRLRETARYAKEHGYDYFATTLTVSRTKKADVINPIGLTLAEEFDLTFIDRDFKKSGGQNETSERSEDYGVYRQHYCGCTYSKVQKDS